ncbi:MAG: alcohol dehydrogenase catalytic domain-containing protein [Chloroflexota bacterium]
MRAAVLHGSNDLRVEEVPDPLLQPGDLLVRTYAAAVCGTDLRIVSGSKTRGVRLPGIIGHELAGEVVAVAPPAAAFAVGDRVSVAPIISCGTCHYCLRGRENLCGNQEVLGYNLDGGFAELVRIPARAARAGNVFRLAPGIDYAAGALAEPLACCINGHEKLHLIKGQSVLIMGAGPIGLMHLLLAAVAGAGEIIVSEPQLHRRDLARALGATVVVDPASEVLADVVAARTDGLGADAVILAIGVPRLVDDALKLARKGGVVNLFAGFPDRGEATIEANVIHYNETVVVGTSSSTLRHHQRAIDLLASGQIDLRRLVTATYPLAATTAAFAQVERREGLRVVVLPQV